MTQEEFKKILEENDYYYKEEGNRIIIDSRNRNISLDDIETISENVTFSNKGWVNLDFLDTLPKGIVFYNE